MFKKILITSVFAMFLFVGVAQAQTDELPDPGILPGNPFYFLKSTSESIGTFFSFGKVAKVERYVSLANKRLAEAEALAEKGDEKRAEEATERYQERISKALERAKEARVEGVDVDEVMSRVAEATLKHQEVLGRVYEKVPEQAKEAIQNAMERSAQGYDEALKAISEEKREEIEDMIQSIKQDIEVRWEELKERGIPIPELKEREERKEEIMEMEMEMKREMEYKGEDNNVACTQEVKQCPDGSFVGRRGPTCEFESCSSEGESIREESKQEAEEMQENLEKSLEGSDLTEEEQEAIKQAGERIREEEKQRAEIEN